VRMPAPWDKHQTVLSRDFRTGRDQRVFREGTSTLGGRRQRIAS
jgi:hypothetical protein